MNSSKASKRHTARKLSIGLTAAGVLAVGLAVPASAAGTNAITGVPTFINLANQRTVVISGTATSAVTAVRIALDDGQNALFDVPTTMSADSATGKTWRVSVNAIALADGPVAVFASFDGACVQVACKADKTVEKDTDAPEVPTASPDGPATFTGPRQILIESIGDQARTHFTTGSPASAPNASSPVVPYPYTVRATQQIKAIAYDLAGNASPTMVMDYTVVDAIDLVALAARAQAAADAAAAAAARAQAAADAAAADAAAKAVAANAAAAAAAQAVGTAEAAAKAQAAATAKAAADAAAANAKAKANVAAVAKAAAAKAAAEAKVAALAAAKAAPRVIARTPAPNRSAVGRRVNVTAKFSTSVTGVTARSFTLRTKSGKAVAARVTYNSRTRVATLNPTRRLAANTRYVVTLSSAIKATTAAKALPVTRWNFGTGRRG